MEISAKTLDIWAYIFLREFQKITMTFIWKQLILSLCNEQSSNKIKQRTHTAHFTPTVWLIRNCRNIFRTKLKQALCKFQLYVFCGLEYSGGEDTSPVIVLSVPLQLCSPPLAPPSSCVSSLEYRTKRGAEPEIK